MRAMLVRLGAVPTIIVVKQPHFSTRDQELFSGQLPNSIVDQWNAMIDRTVAGLPNIKVVDPNVGWDADTMMTNLHPNDLGEDHIAQQLFTTLGLS